jgi:hypothetical protein
MKPSGSETRYRRVWFGANARVTIGPGFLHRAGLGGFAIPHPPLANWVLRLGLSGHLSRDLTFAHEFAHFQTAPAAVAHMIVLLAGAYLRGNRGVTTVLMTLVSTQAIWELLSEALVVAEDPWGYRAAYGGISRLSRILFWLVAAVLASAGWVAVMQPAL